MNQSTTKIITGCILIFHAAITLHLFYLMFSDYNGWTLQHLGPFAKLVFTLCWLGVFFVFVILILYKQLFGERSTGQNTTT